MKESYSFKKEKEGNKQKRKYLEKHMRRKVLILEYIAVFIATEDFLKRDFFPHNYRHNQVPCFLMFA